MPKAFGQEIELFWPTVACAISGGLIGYGYYGTIQAACLGAGIGIIAIPILIIAVAIIFP